MNSPAVRQLFNKNNTIERNNNSTSITDTKNPQNEKVNNTIASNHESEDNLKHKITTDKSKQIKLQKAKRKSQRDSIISNKRQSMTNELESTTIKTRSSRSRAKSANNSVTSQKKVKSALNEAYWN